MSGLIPYAWHYTNTRGASIWHTEDTPRLCADLEAARLYPNAHTVTPVFKITQLQELQKETTC